MVRPVTNINRTPARELAYALERGAARHSWIARGLAYAWGRAARVERPLILPPTHSVVGVSGAALGGSGATPVAMQLADDLAARGRRVGLVSHGFGARVSAAQRVEPTSLGVCCDEASLAAQQLRRSGVPVFIAPKRQAALDYAARELPAGSVLILDGVLQAAPRRLDLSCLVVDSAYPWGDARCPPVGDLRARQAALLGAADRLLSVDGAGGARASGLNERPLVQVTRRPTGLTQIAGAALDSLTPSLPLAWLRGRDFGLALAVGRPSRVLAQLRALGLAPSRVHEALDHRGLHGLVRSKKYSRSDVWVTTPKCWLATVAAAGPRFDLDLVGNWLLLHERVELPRGWIDELSASLGA